MTEWVEREREKERVLVTWVCRFCTRVQISRLCDLKEYEFPSRKVGWVKTKHEIVHPSPKILIYLGCSDAYLSKTTNPRLTDATSGGREGDRVEEREREKRGRERERAAVALLKYADICRHMQK